jgi:hypothetical protein
MARTIAIGDIGDYANQQLEKLLRVAVLETDARLKAASPVDTGRFRASWQVGENAAPGGQVGPGTYGAAPPLSRIGYQQERVGNVYSVHNNLPYAEPLAGGPSFPASWGGQYRSKKASPGWVQGVAKDIQSFVRTNADRIGRES